MLQFSHLKIAVIDLGYVDLPLVIEFEKNGQDGDRWAELNSRTVSRLRPYLEMFLFNYFKTIGYEY